MLASNRGAELKQNKKLREKGKQTKKNRKFIQEHFTKITTYRKMEFLKSLIVVVLVVMVTVHTGEGSSCTNGCRGDYTGCFLSRGVNIEDVGACREELVDCLQKCLRKTREIRANMAA
ncbi:uncharacterized protein LOC116288555 isoform X2 [Actinia tenebrosa]|uniref:Uncharacterized protein LOC116288555 isoform X2 n=1 Tax=Actinia tenebrosa TaxID=6105 RepID=A0A6P8HF24_ACTTE|nr:uncharacterized protein LOC116288555 isoform X2 [Actinia tenebrosa]